MIRNYFKVAVRNLWKNKGFSAVNIIGLAAGLATCLLIFLYVTDELNYDRYNEKADCIYRIDGDIQFGGNHLILAASPDPMGATLKKDFPQVEQYVRFRGHGGFLVKKGTENVQENKVIYTDSTLFDVFTLPLIAGDANTALVNPNSVVITESIAKKYFSSTNVVGKTLTINDTSNFKITGVIKDMPKQSHFNYDFFVSMYGQLSPYEINQWTSNNFNTYIVLKKGANPKALEAQFDAFTTKYLGPSLQSLNLTMDQFKKSGNHISYTLTPLTSIHLYSNKSAELGINSNIEYVYIFSAIAVFILLIACVNFMNLSTARSSGRAKEVGVRKVLGSMRKSLIIQFIIESLLISCIALLLALAIAVLLLPYFNQLAGKEISLSLVTNVWLLPSLLLLVIVVGLLAGSYPAFYLSSFKPVEVLKGKLAAGFSGSWLRSGLVVFQFWISIILIIGTLVVYNQLTYIRNKNIGYKRDNVLIIQNTDALGTQVNVFKNNVLKLNGVQDATMTGFLPTSDWRNDSPIFSDASLDQKKAVSLQIWNVDEHYIPTLNMQMAKGRNFSTQFLTDSSGIILNEAAARLFGFADPLNKPLYLMNNFPVKESKDVSVLHVLGVVKDFNFNSLHDNVTPLCFLLKKQTGRIAFRITSANPHNLVKQIENEYKTIAPGQPFAYSFMDDDYNKMYDAEQRTGSLSATFSALAILIACLGLFGLVTYAAEQRRKEIGIRKVLGANVGNIVTLLSKDFLKLVLVAAIIAFPVAWWAMNQWLQSFAYRISISWWVFVFAGIIALLIAITTISLQAVKAALANPVKNLRSE